MKQPNTGRSHGNTSRRFLRRRLAQLAVIAAIANACSSSGEPATPQSARTDPDVEEIVLEAAGSWGEGRAEFAVHLAGADRTIVATTTDLYVVEGDGEPLLLDGVGRVGRRFAPTTDGELVAYVDATGTRVGLVDLSSGEHAREPERVPGSTVHSLVIDDARSAVIVSTDTSIVAVPLGGGPGRVVMVAAEDTTLGPAALAPDKSWYAALMSRETTSSDGAEEPTLAVGTTDGDSALPTPLGDLGLGVGTRVAKVVIAGDGVHVGIVGAPATDPFAAELMIWNRATNSVTERIPLAGDASTANWVFGDSDRLALVTSEGLEFRDLGATVLSRASFEPAEAVLALTAVDHGGIVSQHSDGSVRLWSARGDLVTVLGHGLGSIGELRTAPGDSITAVDATGRIRAWSASDGRLVLDHDGFARGAVNDLTSSADGRTVAAASSTGRVRVIDATSDTHPPGDASGRAAAVIDHGGRNVDSVAFDPTGALLATGVGERLGEGVFDDSVGIWTTPRSTAEERSAVWLQGEEKLVPGCTFFRNIVRFAPAGGLLATSSHDDIIEIWDSADGSLVQRLPAHESSIHDMTFSPDGRFLASSSDDSTLRIWDVEDERVDRTLDTVPGGYWSLEYLPDGDALVVSGISGVVSVIDVRDGSTQRTFEGTKSRLSTLAVSGDGRLVSAGDDLGGVVVWSTASGRRVARVDGHAEPVRSTTFTNDGATLVSGSQDGTIRAWTLRHDA